MSPARRSRISEMAAEILLLLLLFVALLALNVPVAFCIGLASLATIACLEDVTAAAMTAQRMAKGIESFPLLAIPFFVLSGLLMGEGGIARCLMYFAAAL